MTQVITAVKTEFTAVMNRFSSCPAMRHLANGVVTLDHYKSYLRETYFYTRENPQIQALAAVYFRGAERDLVRTFFRHATQEIGHDQLALNDLATLGESSENIRRYFPLPSTVGLISFPYYYIQHRNPVGYLGYLFFLEFMPTTSGRAYMDMLAHSGIRAEAMTFLRDHTEIDVAHNKLMEEYAPKLIRNEADLNAVRYALNVTGELFAAMLLGAIENASTSQDLGIDWLEDQRLSNDRVRAAAE
jgi:pyrroloquinoline quinone (PQQ) biosynthesis protein C